MLQTWYRKTKSLLSLSLVLFLLLSFVFEASALATASCEKRADIKWVDFTVPSSVLNRAMSADIERHGTAREVDWIELLAYLGAKCGGDFKKHKPAELDALLKRIDAGETIADITAGTKHYAYYFEAYSAVLRGFVGDYEAEVLSEDGVRTFEPRYGLKAFSPIAAGFSFHHYDDFGNGRNYGYNRRHLGHDLMAPTGTPVTAVESGVVEEMGWNQYGGWRVGIRSFDGLRYYYYAHLRQNRPYAEGLEKGGVVMAGDVVGYVGRTGYSPKENTNGIKQSHLHLGLQLVFDESEKEGANQIWIDLFELTKFLQQNRSETIRHPETKEHRRAAAFREPIPEDHFVPPALAAPGASSFSTDDNELSGGSAEIPVLMYHDILKDPNRQGLYTITPWQFEEDLKFLKSRGYETITTAELLAFAESGAPLPEKPVLLTFDDGHYNNVYYAEPLLAQYGMKAVMFIVGAYSERSTEEGEQNPNYSFVSWDEVRAMEERGVFEVQSHSWGLHENNRGRLGIARKAGESIPDYEAMLRRDFGRINDKIYECTGRYPVAFAHPFGYQDSDALPIMQECDYLISFCSHEGKAIVTPGDLSSLVGMKRILRSNRKTLGGLLGW